MLAQYVVLESPLQLVADAPDAYRGQAGFDFIREVPVVWDEIKVLAARPDEAVAIARRNGADWYIGAIGDSDGENLRLPLSFLGDGEYTMTTYRDAEDADIEPNNILIETATVGKQDEIVVQMAPNGGFAGKLEFKY